MMEIKPKKSVSWGKVSYQPMSDQHYFTEEEMPAIFYSNDELRVIRKRVRGLVRNLEKMDLTTDCWRGLGKFASRTNAFTRFRKHVGPVIEQYERMKKHGEEDFFSVGAYSAKLSRREVREALNLAAMDFMDAYAIHQENWREQKWNEKTVDAWFGANAIKAAPRHVAGVCDASEMARSA